MHEVGQCREQLPRLMRCCIRIDLIAVARQTELDAPNPHRAPRGTGDYCSSSLRLTPAAKWRPLFFRNGIESKPHGALEDVTVTCVGEYLQAISMELTCFRKS